MMRFLPNCLSTCVLLAAGSITAGAQPVDKDVIILGGGAAGVYAATLLRSMGQSIAIIEQRSRFGGHTETYHVPGTNRTIDYGVQGFTPLVDGSYSIIQQFFADYDIATTFIHRSETGSGTTRYFDFSNIEELANFTTNTDLTAYTAQADKYPWLGYQTQTPYPIPGDLVLSFGDFVSKYSLQSSVYNIFFNVEGLGDILSLPAYYVLRELNSAHLLALSPSSQGLLTTADGFNQEAYLGAQSQIGTDALVSSTVQSASRNDDRVVLTIQTPSGQRNITAGKLLVAIPPTLTNLGPLELDDTESDVFGKFAWSNYYAGLVNATGFAPGESFQNAGRDTLYNLPSLPALYQISQTAVSSIYLVRYAASSSMRGEEVQANILSTVERVRAAVVSDAEQLPPIQLLTLANHSPFDLHVSAAELAAGFKNQLNGLQGHRSTWYSGAAFFGASSSDIWNASQAVVRDLLAA